MLEPTREVILLDRRRIMTDFFPKVERLISKMLDCPVDDVEVYFLAALLAQVGKLKTCWKQHEESVDPASQDCLWNQMKEEMRRGYFLCAAGTDTLTGKEDGTLTGTGDGTLVKTPTEAVNPRKNVGKKQRTPADQGRRSGRAS